MDEFIFGCVDESKWGMRGEGGNERMDGCSVRYMALFDFELGNYSSISGIIQVYLLL